MTLLLLSSSSQTGRDNHQKSKSYFFVQKISNLGSNPIEIFRQWTASVVEQSTPVPKFKGLNPALAVTKRNKKLLDKMLNL